MTEIVFFCSPIGLGHATRDLAIINELKLESCKIYSGSSAIEFFQKIMFKHMMFIHPQNLRYKMEN